MKILKKKNNQASSTLIQVSCVPIQPLSEMQVTMLQNYFESILKWPLLLLGVLCVTEFFHQTAVWRAIKRAIKKKILMCSNSFNVEENSLMMPWNRGTAQTPFCQQIWDGNSVCGQVLSLPLLLRLASWFLFCTSTMPAAAMRYWHVLLVEQGAHGDRTRRAFRRHSSQNTSITGPQNQHIKEY